MSTLEETNEKVFLKDSNVTVTQSRLIVDGKTFPIRNISSVAKQTITRNRLSEILIMVIGVLCVIIEGIRIIGVILIIVSLVMFLFLKKKYAVRINTNAGEEDGLISENVSYVQKIVNAINDAIVYRG
jgi:hypothetical protein